MTKLNQEFAWRTWHLSMQLTEMGQIVLATSSILAFENNNNPFRSRQQWVNYCMNYAKLHQTANENIKKRAKQLEKNAIKSMDALHIACAEAFEAKSFYSKNFSLE